MYSAHENFDNTIYPSHLFISFHKLLCCLGKVRTRKYDLRFVYNEMKNINVTGSQLFFKRHSVKQFFFTDFNKTSSDRLPLIWKSHFTLHIKGHSFASSCLLWIFLTSLNPNLWYKEILFVQICLRLSTSTFCVIWFSALNDAYISRNIQFVCVCVYVCSYFIVNILASLPH